VSATGMFKIAFPWAKDQEKEDERKYLKSRDCVSQSEVAGNIWISPVSGRSSCRAGFFFHNLTSELSVGAREGI